MDWIVNPIAGFQQLVECDAEAAACDAGGKVLNYCTCTAGLISCNHPGDLVAA